MKWRGPSLILVSMWNCHALASPSLWSPFFFFFLISCQLALHDHCVAVLVHLYCMGIAGISRITLGFHDLYFSISHLSHFFVCPSDHLRFSVIHSLKCNFLLSSFICVSSKKKSVWHTIYHDSWISICGCILVTLHPFELHLLSCSFKRIFCGELVLLLSPCISTFIIFLAFSVHMLSQLYDWYNINYTNRESYIILITLHLEAGAFGFNSIHRGTHRHNINMQLIRKLCFVWIPRTVISSWMCIACEITLSWLSAWVLCRVGQDYSEPIVCRNLVYCIFAKDIC